MRPLAWGLALVLLVVGMVGPAAGEEQCREVREAVVDPDTGQELEPAVEVCRQPVWFRAADEPEGWFANLAGAGVTSHPTWATEPPTSSAAEGGGAGYITTTAEPLAEEPTNVTTFEGTFAGPIESIAVDLYGYNVGGSIDLGHVYHRGHELRANVSIDDTTLVSGAAHTVPTQFDDGRLLAQFAFVELLDAFKRHGMATGQDAEHEIRIEILPVRDVLDDSLYVFDAEEVPSGMVFNETPEVLSSYTWVFADDDPHDH